MKNCILYWMFLGALSFISCEKDENDADFFLSAEVNGVELSIIETHNHNRREVSAGFDWNLPPQRFSIGDDFGQT